MRSLWSPWTCRPFLSLFLILATISCFLHSIESPAPVGKMYPRGNHWAVGHLMGKKSVNSFLSLQHTDYDRDHTRDPRTEETTRLHRDARLMQRKTHRQKTAQAHKLALLHSGWRREDRYKYLREITDLLLLALKLQENKYF